jgi:hypothetical protein
MLVKEKFLGIRGPTRLHVGIPFDSFAFVTVPMTVFLDFVLDKRCLVRILVSSQSLWYVIRMTKSEKVIR